MNEAETRAEHIGPALAAAGWGQPEKIGRVFAGFQKYLYLTDANA